MKYKLTAYRADNTAIGESEFPVFDIDQAIVVRLPESTLTDVDKDGVYDAVKAAFPDRFVLLISASVEIMQLEPITEGQDTSLVSSPEHQTTCSCAGQGGFVPHDAQCPAHPDYDLGRPTL